MRQYIHENALILILILILTSILKKYIIVLLYYYKDASAAAVTQKHRMTKLYLQMISRAILVLAGTVFAYGTFTQKATNVVWKWFVVLLVLGSVILNALDRDYYLPFLGQTVWPLPPGGTGGDTAEEVKSINVTNLPPNTTVVFWASRAGADIVEDPMTAYADYSNSYITKSDNDGVAVARLACPSEYSVTRYGIFTTKLDRHIHYRYELPQYKGLFSRVLTKDLDANCE